MNQVIAIFFLLTCSSSCKKQELTGVNIPSHDTIPSTEKNYHYLALGDSYTIGHDVPAAENFPNQATALLKTANFNFETRIIATTGWTTDELERGIVNANALAPLRDQYDMVSLLIGVNNQYRGRPVDSYKTEFEELLKKAILYAGNRPQRVVVLSIPDWGVTPFADGSDRARIAREIDAYNAANKELALRYNIHYIDITPWTREAALDRSLLASDGLHPSGKEYRRWSDKIADWIKPKL